MHTYMHTYIIQQIYKSSSSDFHIKLISIVFSTLIIIILLNFMFNNYRYRKVIDPYNVMVFDREKHMGWKKIHDIS